MTYEKPFGLYIHYPFCAAKCPYCDFNSHVAEVIDEARWRDAYLRVIDYYAAKTEGRVLSSIFFGGGTPSLMSADMVGAIIDRAQRSWRFVNDVEITLEANPTSVEIDKFDAFRQAGVNRVSIGVQALNDTDLKFLGRQHSYEEALKAIKIAANIFDRYSFDLIYARPNQKLEDWGEEIHKSLELGADHMSLYQLTIERSTPFFVQHRQGLFDIPDEELAADFYHLTQDVMEGAGVPAYEVSNHARAGHESRHNLIYWHYGDYIGIGPGAHGRLTLDSKKYALRDHSSPDVWLRNVEEKGSASHEPQVLSGLDQFMEGLMMGLRLPVGLDVNLLQQKSGIDFDDAVDDKALARVMNEGWAVREGDILRLSREGLLRLNALVPYILSS